MRGICDIVHQRLVVEQTGFFEVGERPLQVCKLPAEFAESEVCVLPADFKLGPLRVRASSASDARLLGVLGRAATSSPSGLGHRFEACQQTGDAVAHAGQQSCDLINDILDGLSSVRRVRCRGAEGDGRLIGQATLAAQVLDVIVETRLRQLEAEVVCRFLFEMVCLVDYQHIVVRYERAADCGIG